MRVLGELFAVTLMVVVLAGLGGTVARPAGLRADDLVVYGDALASGWVDWSWDTTRDFAATSPVHSGTHSLAVTYTAAWGGLYLHSSIALDGTLYQTLSFWTHGGSAGGQLVAVAVYDQGGSVTGTVNLPALGTGWAQQQIALADLGNPTTIAGLVWQDRSGGPQPTFYLDDVVLVARTGPPPPTPTPGPGPALGVNAIQVRHPIPADIYGMNFADEGLARELRLPVRRWGGNSTSRYNYLVDTNNTGSDWYYENVPEDNPNPGQLPDGGAVDRFVEQDRRTGARSVVTVPLIGWVAKRRLESHPYDCGFKVSLYGAQQSVDPWDTDCGNGVLTDGTEITWNDPTDTSVAIGADFVAGWINHLTGRYGTAANGGVAYYQLDNEPMLWYDTHRDVHPQPTSYDEMRDRTWAYAPAVKAADPSAKTLGPSLWGWTAYFWSALDWESGGDWWNHPQDRLAHGDVPFVEWYLQQMAAYEQAHGTRILDFLDVHFYPPGVALTGAGDPATQAWRLRSTRLLWDPTYSEESWIGQPVYLVPRMLDWVARNYPVTRISLTEYNWGALDHINGALAQADVLGIFGREGLHLATLWGPPATTDPGAFAFRMFRNYDGGGRGFGEASLAATSADEGRLSVFAARRISDDALTLVAVNKSADSLTSAVTMVGYNAGPNAAVWSYGPADLAHIVRQADQPVTTGGFSHTFPASSITLLEIPLDPNAVLRCDCNGDRLRNRVDLDGLVLELLDGDGIAASAVPGGTYPGNPGGCDSTADGLVDAADLACTITTLTMGPGFCGQ